MDGSTKVQSTVPDDMELSDNRRTSEEEGTATDVINMRRMGKPQLLQRNFSSLTIFGFSMILMSTWETLLGTAAFSLLNGGTAGSIYIYIATFIGFGMVIISMAEMASMAPTAGGQYHWVSELAPPSAQKLLSYLISWLCVLGWQAGSAAGCFLAGTEIQGLIVLNYPDYIPQRWHGTLLAIALILVSTLFNTYLVRRLPLVEGILLALHILGFFAIFIPLWVFAPRSDAKAVFTQFSDGGGWGSTGLATLVGMLSPVLALIGSDAATHMSEELRNASKSLPKTMVFTAIFNGALGFLMLVTFCFCVGDLEEVLSTKTGYPFIQVFHNATLSIEGATTMASILIILSQTCAVTNMATASRQLFAFARDRGVPFHSLLEKVSLGWDIPLYAVLTTTVISILLTLISIGSTITFNQITALGTVALLTSYMVSVSCMALKRICREPLLPSCFSLGRFGLLINVLGLMFLILAYVMIFFPPAPHPTPAGMNWSIVIYSGVLTISLTYFYFKGRHVYDGPVEHIRKNM